MVVYEKSDRNFLKCAICGKYKVDTLEDFEVNFRENGTKDWLCVSCNKHKKLFKSIMFGTNLEFIVVPSDNPVGCRVFTKEMYI